MNKETGTKTIGLDIGTTSVSAVVFNEDKQEVLLARTARSGHFLQAANEWERLQDADELTSLAKNLLEELLSDFPDICGIGLTGQMHGILYTDEDGHAVSPLYTWQDRRGDVPLQDGRSMSERVREMTGLTVPAGYGLLTHLTLQETGGETKNEPAGVRGTALCTIGDYLGMVLTGRKRPIIHISNAASLGFYDVGKNGFRTDALKKMGMDLSLLPEVTDEYTVLGTFRGIPVTAAVGDNQASFLGSVGLKENALLLNIGTGGQISMLADRPYSIEGIETRPMTKDRYLLAGASLCGGRAYAALERFFRSYAGSACGTEEPQYAVMEQIAEREWRKDPQQAFRLQVDTTFMGTREDPLRRGSIANLSEDTFTPEHLILGVMAGMARELHDMYRKIEAGTGLTAASMTGSGNGLRNNRILQEICCHIFGKPMALSGNREEAACGAAAAAAEALRQKK